MNEKNTFQKRQTARWAEIKDLLEGKFVRNEETESSGYKTKKGFLVSRVNVFGVVLSKDFTELMESAVIDDGTGNIGIKAFEKKGFFENIEVGDVVNVLGKMREYNNSNFISIEAVRKSNSGLFSLRKKEIPVVQKFYETEKDEGPKAEEMVVLGSGEKVLEVLRALDKGDGVDIEILAEKCGTKEIAQIVNGLIKNGEVFEIMPGKLKVLE